MEAINCKKAVSGYHFN